MTRQWNEELNVNNITIDGKVGNVAPVCILCETAYQGEIYPPRLCPTCKQSLIAAMNMAAPKFEPEPWDQMPEHDNQFVGLNEMAKAVYQGNKDKGFWDKERNVGETLMLVVTELAEALEAHRKGNTAPPTLNMPEISKENFEMFFKDTFEDEIADAVIRILDLCGGWNIDLEWHVREKVKYNVSRERLHGKQY